MDDDRLIGTDGAASGEVAAPLEHDPTCKHKTVPRLSKSDFVYTAPRAEVTRPDRKRRYESAHERSRPSMEHSRLGATGLEVSRICLGTMTFGLQSDEDRSIEILDSAAESGVTFIDTADVYPARGPVGLSEEILGRWLRGKRDRFIIATKCGGRVGPLPWEAGCSRKHILSAVESSLRRLGSDYIDLYQLHFFDPSTPIDETMAALDQLVQSGKVRYVGCSNWAAFQVALSLGHSEVRDVVRFSSVQPRYSLLYRTPEDEIFPSRHWCMMSTS
jgi:1-deoxyxylulose-5-phosphate synthase